MISIFAPVDPHTVSVRDLKERAGLLLTAMEHGQVPDMPLAPGCFRCFLCRREFGTLRTEAETLAEYRRRFGGHPDDKGGGFTLCGDCNVIVAGDMGLPL